MSNQPNTPHLLVAVAIGLVVATQTAVRADDGKAIVDKVASTVSAAKALDYVATFSAANISDSGVVGDPNVYTVKCKEQEPNAFRITVSNKQGVVAEFASGSHGGVYYDPVKKRYMKFGALASDSDWGQLHDRLDKVTGSGDMGNIFDSTLIHKPMFDLEGQFHRDSAVTYEVSTIDMSGKKATRVWETCTTDGNPMHEAVLVDTAGMLLGYAAYLDLNKTPILAQRQMFDKLDLLSDPLPDSTFQFTPPADAQPFDDSGQ